MLQGSVIPRCFGFFEATLPDNTPIIPWLLHGLDTGRDDYDVRQPLDLRGLENEEESEGLNDTNDDNTRNKYQIKRSRHDPRVPSPLRISLLLLEELDLVQLPIGVNVTDEVRCGSSRTYGS